MLFRSLLLLSTLLLFCPSASADSAPLAGLTGPIGSRQVFVMTIQSAAQAYIEEGDRMYDRLESLRKKVDQMNAMIELSSMAQSMASLAAKALGKRPPDLAACDAALAEANDYLKSAKAKYEFLQSRISVHEERVLHAISELQRWLDFLKNLGVVSPMPTLAPVNPAPQILPH